MLAGNPFIRNFTGTFAAQAISYACLDYNGPATPETNALPDRNCPDGVRAQVFFPSCWDGVNANSANHMEHMAYPDLVMNGGCPETHPKLLPKLMFEIIWDTLANKDKKGIYVYANGDPTGMSHLPFPHLLLF